MLEKIVELATGETALSFLRRLIAAQPEGEDAVQDIIAAALLEAGCTVCSHDYDPTEVPVIGEFAVDSARNPERRKAVVGRLRGTAPNCASLLMFAHPDGETVQDTQAWQHAPFQGEINIGRIYGWGVADDLAGCAAAVFAVKALAQSKAPRGDLIFASTPSKRHARGVAELLHDGLTADAALYLHPAESGRGMREIKALACGQIEFRIRIKGQLPETTEPGHTAFSHLAQNPVDKAILVHWALMALADDRAERIRHPLIEAEVGRATNLHIASIQCGDMATPSRLNDVCEMGGALSFPPGESLAQVQAEVEAVIASVADADDWLCRNRPEIYWLTGVTGAEVKKGHPLWKVVSTAVRRVTGEEPLLNPMHTSSDIRNPAVEAGIPCVGLGCLAGDLSQNGRHDEWVDLRDFYRMVDVTAAIARDWCARPQTT